MSEVKRWRMSVGTYMQKPSIFCDLNNEGEFVKFADFQSERQARLDAEAKLRELERKVEHWHVDLSTEDIYILPRIEKEISDTVQAIQESRTRRQNDDTTI